MKKQTRNTEFWSYSTPNKVGPGSYNLSSKPKPRFSSVPFSRAELKSPAFRISPTTLPGPGSYNYQTEWVKNSSPSSSFISNLPKTGPIPSGNSALSHSYTSETPGPGAYNPGIKPINRPHRKFRQLSMIVEATVASIPYKPGEDQVLGPTSYDPSISLIKPKILSTSFTLSTKKRDPLEIKTNRIVGPGKYEVNPDRNFSKPNWVFTSKVEKNLELKPEQLPGPGAYDPKTYARQPRVLVEGFGSTTERDILLTNDPHRPYGTVDHSLQQGVQDSTFQANKLDYYRQKYLNQKTPIPKPAFGTSEKRESVWANTDIAVGPADYDPNAVSSAVSKLINKSPRFKPGKIDSLPGPGPGTYESTSPSKNPIYISKAPRFADKKQETPESYLAHEIWKTKQNRARDVHAIEPNLRFESSSPRFAESTSESPGPGHYKVQESKKTQGAVLYSEDRFGKHGSYIKQSITESEIGPGYYHKEPKIGKKTFNISPEIGDDRPWI